MPKGQKAVVWNQEQDAKLFHAILAAHKLDVDVKAVAKAFGDDVPASCIQLRLQKLRKKARELGLNFQTNAMSTSGSKSIARPVTTKDLPAPGNNSSKKPSVKRKRGGMLTSDSDGDDESMASEASEDEQINGKRFRTAPTTPSRQTSLVGQIIKPRVSPRNLAKKDYKAIEDPYSGSSAYDADGNEIFERSSGEEDVASDDEYGHAEELVKAEEEVAIAVAV